MITVLGSKGSIGRRHCAILTYLGKPHYGIDVDEETLDRAWKIRNSSHVVIATPTDMHNIHIQEVFELNPKIRILCEKPIVRGSGFISELSKVDITMQMQYTELTEPTDNGYSQYNFFNHGRDGLIWDCFQVVALAKGECKLFEDSPIWKCDINGRKLNIQDMDWAYIKYMEKWLGGYRSDLKQLIDMHQKVTEYASKWY